LFPDGNPEVEKWLSARPAIPKSGWRAPRNDHRTPFTVNFRMLVIHKEHPMARYDPFGIIT
jgi:hypothetical protein